MPGGGGGAKTRPDGAAQTYIADIKEYPTGKKSTFTHLRKCMQRTISMVNWIEPIILEMLYCLDCLVHGTKKKYVHNDVNFQFLMNYPHAWSNTYIQHVLGKRKSGRTNVTLTYDNEDCTISSEDILAISSISDYRN